MDTNKKRSRYVRGQAVEIPLAHTDRKRFVTLKRFIGIVSEDPWIERWKVKFPGDPDLYEKDLKRE
jgi:hypothetical protein